MEETVHCVQQGAPAVLQAPVQRAPAAKQVMDFSLDLVILHVQLPTG